MEKPVSSWGKKQNHDNTNEREFFPKQFQLKTGICAGLVHLAEKIALT